MLQVLETEETIDIELLKKKEKIYFFEDIILFEDELADNGCAVLNVKMVSFCGRKKQHFILVNSLIIYKVIFKQYIV